MIFEYIYVRSRRAVLHSLDYDVTLHRKMIEISKVVSFRGIFAPTDPRGGGGGGGGGGTYYISEYGNVRALEVYFSALPLYDKVGFSTSNYMKSHSSLSFHYLNSPLNL